jgi:hypothetical protein
LNELHIKHLLAACLGELRLHVRVGACNNTVDDVQIKLVVANAVDMLFFRRLDKSVIVFIW